MAQHYEKRSSDLPFKKILWNNFIAGIAWALGVTIGFSLIFGILSLIANKINYVPIVGTFVSDVINFVLKTNPNLRR